MIIDKGLTKEVKCVCGQRLPHHLAVLGDLSHVCSCKRAYNAVNAEFILCGTEPNPFVQETKDFSFGRIEYKGKWASFKKWFDEVNFTNIPADYEVHFIVKQPRGRRVKS